MFFKTVHTAQPHADDGLSPSPHSFIRHIPSSSPTDARFIGRPVTLPQRFSRPPAPLPLYPAPGSALAPSHYLLPEHAEHRLRRKTPSGTIDAGYDGNPSHLASGPPPFKQMIMPTSSRPAANPAPLQSDRRSHVNLGPLDERPMHPSYFYFRPSEAPEPLHPESNGASSGNPQQAHPLQFTTSLALDCAPNGPLAANQPYNPVPRVPTALQPVYQQPPGLTIFQNGGVLPPSPWSEMHPATCAHPGSLRVSPYNNAYGPSPLHHFGSPGSVLLTPSLNMRLKYEPPQVAAVQVPSQKFESLTLESGRYAANESHSQERYSPAQFSEKVLALGHRAYADLLTQMHQGINSSNRSPIGPRATARMAIFPRLPRSASYPNVPLASSQSSVETGHQTVRETSALALHNTPFHAQNQDPDHLRRERAPMTPLAAASTTLRMLTQLCEQSEWKWVDGMLLGGCLHYGLEHYEQALEWFQRIVALDAEQVEAVSNVAASLYCLNRLEEAEKYWKRAICKQPAYLEAVELLVHLLCTSQRSREAVDIITFVQQSLRLDSSVASRDTGAGAHANASRVPRDFASADAPGFGLSGYSIPGSESGRMIALIHAKGNLLYALKDIDRASDAFEEAVLISTGKSLQCIRALICRIQSVLYNPLESDSPNTPHVPSSGALLLPPERARRTAQLVFTASGELPGLRYVPSGMPKKSAISTTSNSLLSLAKIFQDAMSNGASYPRLLQQPPGIGDILALYYLSLSLSESPSTANNVGILLASIQHVRSPSTLPAAESPGTPQIPGIVPGSGLALALAYYNYGLSLDPRHVHLHTNLGSLLKDIGQLDLAIQMYERAVACDGTFDIALTNLANAVKDRGRISDAIRYYRRAVESNPQFAEAVCGLSTALNSVCDWRGRGGVLLCQGRYDRWHVDDHGMLKDAREEGVGSGLMQKVVTIVSKQLADSSQWGVGILQGGELETLVRQLEMCGVEETALGLDLKRELGKWAGRRWEGSRLLRLVERGTKMMMHRWYTDRYVTGRASVSEYARPRLPSQLPVPAAPTVLPFHTFTCPLSARDIRMISQRNAARIGCSTLKSPWLSDTVYPPPPPPCSQLNVGYVSSDFNNHPLAHLMQSVFGFHDARRVKAVCYATTASDRSVHRQQIEREAPVFRDVSNWPAEQIVQQIVKDKIHILVNLNGYTRGAKNEVFAARPAPIQMAFMGFAGTLGAEWCDYLLADETAIPHSTLRPVRSNRGLEDVFRDERCSEAEDWVYSENIIFCRDTFFCCDHAQSCEPWERTLTWEDELRRRWKMRNELFPNLADDTVIMGNFNQLYKIDPCTFRTWLRILSNVPKAVLWLLRFPELGETNLRRTARAWAGEEVASRIIFTDVAPKQQHIARARVCDIFLDTPECNAHTTAADVLWSSTPLLTSTRYPYKMCSRMAASILKGALPKDERGFQAARELIATDDGEYETLATRLAQDLRYNRVDQGYCEGRGRLAEIRRLLFDAKWTCALFDTRRWVSDLETAYEVAWRRWVAGESGDIHL
ncbi:glycosyltransferase family 41 protein [Xylariaceae sp. FL0594]|nr:glycosyltransferase family 41 protein [Xylariaceae sp. FL0594]